MFRLLFFTPTGFSGIIMLACLIIIWIFSTRQMRNFFYNSFLGVHHLFLLFYVMMFYHPLSNIIKYQSNLEEYRPACDFAFTLPNNSMALNFTNHHCQGTPKFTAGPKNVRILFIMYFFIIINFLLLVLDLANSSFIHLFLRSLISIFQTLLHQIKANINGTINQKLYVVDFQT